MAIGEQSHLVTGDTTDIDTGKHLKGGRVYDRKIMVALIDHQKRLGQPGGRGYAETEDDERQKWKYSPHDPEAYHR
jgi:hypothetical protein